MCYLMAVALFLMICQQNAIPFLPYLAVEFHGPRVLHAALVGDTSHYRLNVVAAGLLAFGWLWAAVVLFRRRGWQ
jgi:ABC-type Na+ efflux pump permease subunit